MKKFKVLAIDWTTSKLLFTFLQSKRRNTQSRGDTEICEESIRIYGFYVCSLFVLCGRKDRMKRKEKNWQTLRQQWNTLNFYFLIFICRFYFIPFPPLDICCWCGCCTFLRCIFWLGADLIALTMSQKIKLNSLKRRNRMMTKIESRFYWELKLSLSCFFLFFASLTH